jgi:hypothetical protein
MTRLEEKGQERLLWRGATAFVRDLMAIGLLRPGIWPGVLGLSYRGRCHHYRRGRRNHRGHVWR